MSCDSNFHELLTDIRRFSVSQLLVTCDVDVLRKNVVGLVSSDHRPLLIFFLVIVNVKVGGVLLFVGQVGKDGVYLENDKLIS